MSMIPAAYDEVARSPILIVTGPTATGKTHLAVELAREFGGEILSVDSRQVYRGMDIGTGKDISEYSDGGPAVPCHLLDIVDPAEKYDLFQFLQDARQCLCQVHSRGCLPILCGGSALYLAALLDGYEMAGGPPDWEERKKLQALDIHALLEILRSVASPELLARTDVSQERRIIRAIEIARSGVTAVPPPLSNALILAPKFTREEVRERIRVRLDARLEAGLVAEVRGLHEAGIPYEKLEWFGLEYRYLARYLSGVLSYDEMHDELLNHIRDFAKSQDTWFRKLEREGHPIHWIPGGKLSEAIPLVQEFLSGTQKRRL